MLDRATLILPLAAIIDLDGERARLNKESGKWTAELNKLVAKLANPAFVNGAPPETVEDHRERKIAAEAMLAKLGKQPKVWRDDAAPALHRHSRARGNPAPSVREA